MSSNHPTNCVIWASDFIFLCLCFLFCKVRFRHQHLRFMWGLIEHHVIRLVSCTLPQNKCSLCGNHITFMCWKVQEKGGIEDTGKSKGMMWTTQVPLNSWRTGSGAQRGAGVVGTSSSGERYVGRDPCKGRAGIMEKHILMLRCSQGGRTHCWAGCRWTDVDVWKSPLGMREITHKMQEDCSWKGPGDPKDHEQDVTWLRRSEAQL